MGKDKRELYKLNYTQSLAIDDFVDKLTKVSRGIYETLDVKDLSDLEAIDPTLREAALFSELAKEHLYVFFKKYKCAGYRENERCLQDLFSK